MRALNPPPGSMGTDYVSMPVDANLNSFRNPANLPHLFPSCPPQTLCNDSPGAATTTINFEFEVWVRYLYE